MTLPLTDSGVIGAIQLARNSVQYPIAWMDWVNRVRTYGYARTVRDMCNRRSNYRALGPTMRVLQDSREYEFLGIVLSNLGYED